MRTDEKFLELIHAEIDGAASEEERAVLREYLAANPAARIVQSDLAKLADVLSRVEAVDPPEDLTRSIMAALPAPRPPVGIVAHRKHRHAWFSALKYGYALAAGLLLGLVLARVEFHNTRMPEASDLLGTMSAREQAAQSGASDSMKLDLPDLRGSAVLTRSDSGIVIRFDMNARQRAEVVVSLDGGRFAFRGFDQQLPNARAFQAGQDRISFGIEGENRSVLLLATRNDAEVIINLKFIISGQLVQNGTLRLPRKS